MPCAVQCKDRQRDDLGAPAPARWFNAMSRDPIAQVGAAVPAVHGRIEGGDELEWGTTMP